MAARRESKAVTKSVRFSPEETALIESISRREHLSEGTLMRKLVLEGIARLRLDQAIADYATGDLNLGEAALAAGVGVRRMMMELDRRGIDLSSGGELPASLETLADLFGGSQELHETIAQLRGGGR